MSPVDLGIVYIRWGRSYISIAYCTTLSTLLHRTATMGKAGGVWGKYVGTVGAIDRMVNALLGAWGSLVAKSPVLTIVVSVICAIVLSGGLGLIGKNIESDGDKLWCVSTPVRLCRSACVFAMPARVLRIKSRE